MNKSFQKDLSKFDRKFFDSEKRITQIGKGSLGGKAQGLVFINDILKTSFNPQDFPQIEISVPVMTVICTDVFDTFMKRNDLYEIAYSNASDDRIAFAFQKANLPFEILGDLRALISQVHSPLAIRSSSMLEDAMYEPFAGIYATKMTPNNQHDSDTRFHKLLESIKFVYASTYFKAAKNYIRVTRHSVEDEKMAVIIQEVVGLRHADRFYPELSGVARSYNFYPTGRAKPEEGVVNLALGLGKTIVDGGKSWSFSPAYPKINPPYGSVGEMLKQTQNEFWAVNMGTPPAYNPVRETEYMVVENLKTAESDNTLRHITSTLDIHSDRISIGTGSQGPRILTFAPLLLLNDVPLNGILRSLLTLCENTLKAPVEIEFAMTFSKGKLSAGPHHFGFLQVRPMVVSNEEMQIERNELTGSNVLISSENVLGNGSIDSISDIVFIKPDSFEAKNTPYIAIELERFNKKLVSEKRPYLLIGFGRWGSSDPWLGIPVDWSQVSGAKTIIEAAMENMNVELSQGSHFFHNLTSFSVCYFSIPFSGDHQIDWDWLKDQIPEEETEFICHVKLNFPLKIRVDGKNGWGVIYKP